MGGPRGAIIRRTGYLCDRVAGGQGWPGAYNRGQRQRALLDGGLAGRGSTSHRGPGHREDAGPLLAQSRSILHHAQMIIYDPQVYCRPPSVLTKTASRGSMSGSSQATSPVEDRTAPPTVPLVSHGSIGSMASIGSLGSVGSVVTAIPGDVATSDSHHQLQRRDSQGLYSFARDY